MDLKQLHIGQTIPTIAKTLQAENSPPCARNQSEPILEPDRLMAHTGPLPKDFARTLKRRAEAISKGKTPRKPKPPKPQEGEKSMPNQKSSSSSVQKAEETSQERARRIHPWLFDERILVSRAELGKWCKFDWVNDPPLTKSQLAKLERERVQHEQMVSLKRYKWLKENGYVTPPREPTPPPLDEEWELEPDY